MIKTGSTTRLSLSKFPLHDINPSNIKETLQHSSTWVLPQVIALLGRVLVPKKVGNLYSFSATIKDLVNRQGSLTFDDNKVITLDGLKGIFNIIKSSPRGSSLGSMKQVGDGIRYAANVPLALSAIKQYKNIKYSEWDWSDPARVHLLDPDFFEFSKTFYQNVDYIKTDYNKTDLINFRETSTLVKSGPKAGTHRTVAATTNILKTGVVEFDELPKLTRLALCQTWIFQPQVYHNLMIVNLQNLDEPAEPLVPTTVIQSISTNTSGSGIPTANQENDWAWLSA